MERPKYCNYCLNTFRNQLLPNCNSQKQHYFYLDKEVHSREVCPAKKVTRRSSTEICRRPSPKSPQLVRKTSSDSNIHRSDSNLKNKSTYKQQLEKCQLEANHLKDLEKELDTIRNQVLTLTRNKALVISYTNELQQRYKLLQTKSEAQDKEIQQLKNENKKICQIASAKHTGCNERINTITEVQKNLDLCEARLTRLYNQFKDTPRSPASCPDSCKRKLKGTCSCDQRVIEVRRVEVIPTLVVKPSVEAKAPVELKPSAEVRPPVEGKPPVQVHLSVEVKPILKAKPPVEVKPSIEVRTPVEVTASEEVKPLIKAKPPVGVKPSIEARSAVDVNPSVEVKPLVKAKPPVGVKPSIEARPAVEVHPSVEVKPLVKAKPPVGVKPSIEARPAGKVHPSVEVKPLVKGKPPVDVKPSIQVRAEVEEAPSIELVVQSLVEATPSEEVKPSIQVRPPVEEKPPVGVTPSAEVKPLLQAKPALLVKPSLEAKPSIKVKPPVPVKPSVQAKSPVEFKPPVEEKPSEMSTPAKPTVPEKPSGARDGKPSGHGKTSQSEKNSKRVGTAEDSISSYLVLTTSTDRMRIKIEDLLDNYAEARENQAQCERVTANLTRNIELLQRQLTEALGEIEVQREQIESIEHSRNNLYLQGEILTKELQVNCEEIKRLREMNEDLQKATEEKTKAAEETESKYAKLLADYEALEKKFELAEQTSKENFRQLQLMKEAEMRLKQELRRMHGDVGRICTCEPVSNVNGAPCEITCEQPMGLSFSQRQLKLTASPTFQVACEGNPCQELQMNYQIQQKGPQRQPAYQQYQRFSSPSRQLSMSPTSQQQLVSDPAYPAWNRGNPNGQQQQAMYQQQRSMTQYPNAHAHMSQHPQIQRSVTQYPPGQQPRAAATQASQDQSGCFGCCATPEEQPHVQQPPVAPPKQKRPSQQTADQRKGRPQQRGSSGQSPKLDLAGCGRDCPAAAIILKQQQMARGSIPPCTKEHECRSSSQPPQCKTCYEKRPSQASGTESCRSNSCGEGRKGSSASNSSARKVSIATQPEPNPAKRPSDTASGASMLGSRVGSTVVVARKKKHEEDDMTKSNEQTVKQPEMEGRTKKGCKDNCPGASCKVDCNVVAAKKKAKLAKSKIPKDPDESSDSSEEYELECTCEVAD